MQATVDKKTFRNCHFLSLILMATVLIGPEQAFAKRKGKKSPEHTKFSKDEIAILIQDASDTMVPKFYIKQIFTNRRVVKYPSVLPKNIHNKQVKRNYSNFYDSYSQHVTKKYLKKWRSRFSLAESKFRVDKEAVAAILLVETGLGSIRGRYHVISVFASIVIEAKRELKNGVENSKRYKKKLNWASSELKALLRLGYKKKLETLKLKGSSSGAFGLAQFLPSSFERWAVDGDKNGKIDLHFPPDAILSVANYLKVQGWKKGLHHPENRDPIFHYNNSEIYVDTILAVAKKLRNKG